MDQSNHTINQDEQISESKQQVVKLLISISTDFLLSRATEADLKNIVDMVNRRLNNLPGVDEKKCSKCNEIKPLTEFYKYNACKKCLLADQTRRRIENPEKSRISSLAYKKTEIGSNKSRIQAAKYYQKNKDKLKARSKKWKEENKEKSRDKRRELNQKYRENLSDTYIKYRVRSTIKGYAKQDVPSEVVETARLLLAIKREVWKR